MKIAVMLRHLSEPGGIRMYTVNLLNALLDIDRENDYLLIYKDKGFLGTFGKRKNVEEYVVRMKNRVLWDQIGVPWVCVRKGVDVIFNPKLSVPLFTRAKTAFTLHGAEQFAVSEVFKWYDRMYFKIAMPIYYKKANVVFTQTPSGKQDIGRYLRVNTDKVKVIRGSYNEFCKIVRAEDVLEMTRSKYSLPDRFMLFVGGITPLKNFGRLVQAFRVVKDRGYEGKLVVVGFKKWKYSRDLAIIGELSLEKDVIFVGYIPDEEMPHFYSLADVLLFPSVYEGYGVPPIEALVSGCPVVASKTGWLRDVEDTPVELIDPYSVDSIVNGIWNVAEHLSERKSAVLKWMREYKFPTWKEYAQEFLNTLKEAVVDKDV